MQSPAAQPCDPRLMKVLMSQYKIAQADPHPNILVWLDEADARQWYFLAVGLEEPFAGGEYLFKLTAPDGFPHQPPKFEFLTQNGVYLPGGAICISVGEFHAEDKPGAQGSYGWRPSLGMKGFASEVVNGLINHDFLESGIRITKTPDAMKRLYAKASAARNRKDFGRLAAAFESLCLAFPDSEPVCNLRRGRDLLAGKPAAPVASAVTPTPVPALAVPAAPAAPAAPAPTLATRTPAAEALATRTPAAEALAPRAPAAPRAGQAPEDGGDSVVLDFAAPPPGAAGAGAGTGPAASLSAPPAAHCGASGQLAPPDAEMEALIASLLAD